MRMETRIEDEIATAEQVQPGSRTSGDILEDFRRWGYLQAKLDPLGQYLHPQVVPELEVTGPLADKARQLYCETAGIEFMHIADRAKRRWIEERFEREEPTPDQRHILDLLVRADIFEQVLQAACGSLLGDHCGLDFVHQRGGVNPNSSRIDSV